MRKKEVLGTAGGCILQSFNQSIIASYTKEDWVYACIEMQSLNVSEDCSKRKFPRTEKLLFKAL